MCLVTWNIAPKIADEDTVCYKVLLYDGKSYESPYFKGTKWEIGNKHHCGRRAQVTSYENWAIIEGGYFHSFMEKEDAIGAASFLGEGAVVFEAIIPKGSIMWNGFTADSRKDSYASKDLVIKENVYTYKQK